MKNILTIDLEDWYQGVEIPRSQWGKYEGRVKVGLEKLLKILAKTRTKATFFVLGYVAEKNPSLVETVHQAGHEIATHGYSHEFIYKQDEEEFARELNKSIGIIEDITGSKIIGHRAAYFSITQNSLWSLEILTDHGLEYDSSIFPVNNYRYGIANSPPTPYRLQNSNGSNLQEVPIATVPLWGRNLPLSGGAYLRLFPYRVIRWGIRRLNKMGRPGIVYLHPWELDPDHPKIDLPKRIKIPHYFNLKSTERKLEALLGEFDFLGINDWLKRQTTPPQEIDLGELRKGNKAG